MIIKPISSRSNPEIKLLQALAQSAKDRRKLGQTVLDGPHLLRAALDMDWPLRKLVVSESAQARDEIAALLTRCELRGRTLPLLVLPDTLFASVSPVDTPTGVMAVIEYPETTSQAVPTPGSVLLLEGVQDPGNLGTIVRTAAAAGVVELVLSVGCTQAWSPRALRAGMGGHFVLQIREHVDLAAYLANFTGPVLATSLGADSRTLYECDLAQPVAWLFGSEGLGLSAGLLQRATQRVQIPMADHVESLNVASAVAVCLFEQRRQLQLRG